MSGREPGRDRRAVISWALYDWANSAFATVMMAGFFPVFFRDVWSAGEASADITFRLGIANSIASLVSVVLGPVLGAIADRGGRRKRFLMAFLILGVTTMAILLVVGFCFAYLTTRGPMGLRKPLKLMALLPLAAPPYIFSISLITLFGKNGMITTSCS